jgi:hypothetical protein
MEKQIEELLSLIPTGQDIKSFISENDADEKMIDEWLWERIYKDRDWVKALSKAEDKWEELASSRYIPMVENNEEDVMAAYRERQRLANKKIEALEKEITLLKQPTNSLDELERWVSTAYLVIDKEVDTQFLILVNELLAKIQELKTITT